MFQNNSEQTSNKQENSTRNQNPSTKKLPDIKYIINRCRFVETSINDPEGLTETQFNIVSDIIKNSNAIASRIELLDGFPLEQLDLRHDEAGCLNEYCNYQCSNIANITCNKYCNHCELCGVVDSPLELGLKPWATDKRIMVLLGDLDKEVIISEKVLAKHSDLFFQGDHLVRVVGNRLKATSNSTHAPLEIRAMSAHNLNEILSTEFVFLKPEKDGFRPVYAPSQLINALLHRARYPSLKHIRAVTEVPVLRPDGTVLQVEGYDPDTELLYRPTRSFPVVPDHPTAGEVEAALALLLEPVCDFPFSNDLGRAVYLSTVLTVVGRFAFSGCVPMVLVDANTPGVGKTKLADTIGLITTGQPLPRCTQANYQEEERRQITSILRKGERLLLIDNIGARFGSPTMDALLTSEIWQDRILGRTQEVTLPNLLQVIATGNNLQLKADTVRRCIRIQLNSPNEHPELRSDFRFPDLEGWVTEHQPQLLSAALTILRAYMAAGKPKQAIVTLGSFAGWGGLIQSAVKWSYGVDPGEARLACGDEMDLDTEILERLIRGFRKLVPEGESKSCRWLIDNIIRAGDAGRDILEALEMGGYGGKRTAVSLGYLLTKFRNRTSAGLYFDYGKKTAEGRLWRLCQLK